LDQCRVPVDNLIGVAGRDLASTLSNLPRERLAIATTAVASAERAFALALDHTHQRTAFGGRLIDLPTISSALAEIRIEMAVARTDVDACVLALNAGELSADEAAGAKYWTTELQFSVIDRCVQLFGGYGYMEEYPIARMWRDCRVQRIYGGANEVMKAIVAKAITRS
jgi:acyl-CoA dehydrogenase